MAPSLISLFLVGILMVTVWLTGTPQHKLLSSRSFIYTPCIYTRSFQALECGSFQETIILFISWILRIGPVWTKEVSPLPGHGFFICPLSETENYKNPKVLVGDSLMFQELSLKQEGMGSAHKRMVLLWVTPVHPTLTVSPDCPSSLLSPL